LLQTEKRPFGLQAGIWRVLRFLGGFLTGLLAIPAIVVGGFALLLLVSMAAERPTPKSGPAPAFAISGRDVSRAGGVTVTWARSDEVTRQRCRGVCDDLMFGFDEAKAIEVLDAKGRCIVCRRPAWQAWLTGLGSRKDAWPRSTRVEGVGP